MFSDGNLVLLFRFAKELYQAFKRQLEFILYKEYKSSISCVWNGMAWNGTVAMTKENVRKRIQK